MNARKEVLLGAHMSIAGGIDKAFYRGSEIGCTAIQIFTHSNRQWNTPALTKSTIQEVEEARKVTGITSCVVHASYLINLGSQSGETVKKSKETLHKELSNCHDLSIPYLVLHPGSGATDTETCLEQIAQSLDEVFEGSHESTGILLENMAGQGNSVGYTLEQLASIKRKSKYQHRIHFCIDTCHLWASGYDFSTKESYEQVIHTLDKILGLSQVKAFHINDSKKGLGSRVDRHENIGEGTIGLTPFSLIMNDIRLEKIPKILETPADGIEDYARNIKTLRSLLT
ncbi:deoxyribonuclease IV [Candidatus Dependentiae bacterium]|nr:deoxyribonuclease IV [Candidatus Dependentiae bacterium]